MTPASAPQPIPVLDPVAGWITDSRLGRAPTGPRAKGGAKPSARVEPATV